MTTTKNPLTLSRYDIDMLVAQKWPEIDNEWTYPSVAPDDFNAGDYAIRNPIPGANTMTEQELDIAFMKQLYHDPMRVIKELEQVYNNPGLTPEEKKQQIADIYGNMSLDLIQDRDSMLLLAAYSPDAVHWAARDIVDRDFAKEAVKYNPLTLYTLPEAWPIHSAAVDAYRSAVFGNGYERHPGLQGIEVPFERNNNMLLSSNSLYDICDLTNYQKAVNNVLHHLDKRAIVIDEDRDSLFVTNPASFIALCEKVMSEEQMGNPDKEERMQDIKLQAYENCLDDLRKMAVTNTVVREQLAEFCFAYNLPPEPQWMSEYMKVQEADRAAAMHKLYELGHQLSWEQDNARRGQQSSAYPQQFVQTVSDLQTKLSLDVVKQQINLSEFWQDVGVAMAEARARAKTNQYPANGQHSFESDRAFFVETRQLARTHQDRSFIKENIQLGINEERERNAGHEREER